MRTVSVCYHAPVPEGSAAGRVLWATVEALRAADHDATAVCWHPEARDLPSWCDHRPVPLDRSLPSRVREVARPGGRSRTLAVRPPEDAVVVAEDFLSWAAVDGGAPAALTVHNLTGSDTRVLRRPGRHDMQLVRAEARAMRRSALVLASSARVAGSCPGPVRAVPLAYPVPQRPLPAVERPVAALVADFGWPPNRWALDRLLEAWPEVHASVKGARLLLAGRDLGAVGTVAGVEVLGAVARSTDVLAEAAVVAFPCPPTTGPKVKVVEAIAHGLAVVTTPAGAEGLSMDPEDGPVVGPVERFGGALAGVLADPRARARRGERGRAALAAGHAPAVAAAARVAALRTVTAWQGR